MNLTRRNAMALGAAAAATIVALPAGAATFEEAVMSVTGGKEAAEGGDLVLTAPEIAENGNTVPVAIDAPGAVAVTFLAIGNPNPAVATFKFGPLAGSREASTRIRLATTQDVVAVAEMEDGSFQTAKQTVKVTIGGCGG
ncbi:thiosulfate oxidation carrier protein SoxY [Brevirhabdus pacifica]|uniref:Thiosulfate oxidation carrier protein SoxY n=1 Tax=Brevirhabdus pacifica TaxID=1267768 RepID=A0A1U7DHQ4_9RHOB|nr:thiosulfate oxidation carrier protein SoxY [Brevirhabdus pacifica]APX89423.1 thiosulfate oxidation carrier protein SoxY [Brevirhabdus pacifica]OWU76555.1 sulfur oxidation protein SoxY [Loktanella sp. 22II-4b]PJJ85934.1 sulfur-oxidizing protein SoxY [Brevirhabdus pacifica]